MCFNLGQQMLILQNLRFKRRGCEFGNALTFLDDGTVFDMNLADDSANGRVDLHHTAGTYFRISTRCASNGKRKEQQQRYPIMWFVLIVTSA